MALNGVRVPFMYQSWINLTFLHWPIAPDIIDRLLPGGLVADVMQETAWITIAPFELVSLRLAGLPPLPGFSAFPEFNLRTYVRGPDGQRGIWFFSLDAANLPAVAAARGFTGLPYFWSRMSVERNGRRVSYSSQRRNAGQVGLLLDVEIGEEFEPKLLDEFLTARFRLYTVLRGKLRYLDVEHSPWPLQRARVLSLDQTLTAAAGLTTEGEPLVHFSEGVAVRIGALRKADAKIRVMQASAAAEGA